jgi:hypothetical protein
MSMEKKNKQMSCCFVIGMADFRGLVNETETMVDVSVEMFSMSTGSNK